ncbi:hypothetical protein JW906_05155 [bacterium]|nr:hypothetical protein [bacterium]
MPGRDGTGPFGQGAGTGRGMGRRGTGFGKGQRPGAGPGGQCVCPKCGARVAHQPGVPCTEMLCPQCGQAMTRG